MSEGESEAGPPPEEAEESVRETSAPLGVWVSGCYVRRLGWMR